MKINRIILTAKLTWVVFLIIGSNIYPGVTFKHDPAGPDDIYGGDEVSSDLGKIERMPRDVIENENVILKFATVSTDKIQDCYADVYVDNNLSKSIKSELLTSEKDGQYWQADIGKYSYGTGVKYCFRVKENGNEIKSSFYSMPVHRWDYITRVNKAEFKNNVLVLSCTSTNPRFNPRINISFSSAKAAKVQVTFDNNEMKNDAVSFSAVSSIKQDQAEISCANIKAVARYNPLKISVYEGDKEIVTQYSQSENSSVGFLNDNNAILKVCEKFYTGNDEKFYGFGERYNALNQRGNILDNYTVSISPEHGLKTYIPVPFYLNSNSYGFYLNSTYYSKFKLDPDKNNKCEIIADFGSKTTGAFEYYLFVSDKPADIITEYCKITGIPESIPVWSLGPWISANEWDKQSEIEAQLDSLKKYNIPNTVVVIEAWSDEETFYIFNDAQYINKPGSDGFSLKDFKFTGRWPDPPGMINNLHKDNMRLVLWNINVLKASDVPNKQRDIDEKYAIDKGYVVKNADGTPFRIPASPWFSRSLNLDFTNKEAAEWWMNKRKYLIDELKVDGFKTDGGEFMWGRGLQFSNGMKGDEIRNSYPDYYINAYYKYIKKYNKEGIVFHRAGTAGAQSHPLAWAGDQRSSFHAFREAIHACLNSSVSGIPFMAYDIAGYMDQSELTPQLYKRSVAQAVFSPVMQFHSCYSGDAGLERSPWNMSRMFNDPSCINVYKKYSELRFNIIPYLYTESRLTSESGIPLMRPLFLQYPDDAKAAAIEEDYMLGNNLIVFPVVEAGNQKNIYLPAGNWYDLWTLKEYTGSKSYNLQVPDDHIPVFIKAGSIVPLNLNKQYTLADSISNNLSSYDNLTFYMLPSATANLEYYDYTNDSKKLISLISDNSKIKIDMPDFEYSVSLVVKVKDFVKLESSQELSERANLKSVIESDNSWYYSPGDELLYVKLKGSNNNRSISVEQK
jgi:alpha-glucosidase (family GH31 glycosyl hydrolase)